MTNSATDQESNPQSNISTPRSDVAFTPDTDLSDIGELINGVRNSVVVLSQAFNDLQPPKSPKLNGDVSKPKPPPDDAAQQISALRKQLVAQDKTQEEHITKIRQLIQEVLMGQISSQLRKHLRDMVREQVGKTIRDSVAEQLAHRVPTGLAKQMAVHRDHMCIVKESLHNADARRINALIRSTSLSEPLKPLLRAGGGQSLHFPPTLVDLFAMPAPAIQSLMEEFDIHRVEDDPREANLNKIMLCFGVTLQMVPAPWAAGAPLITSI